MPKLIHYRRKCIGCNACSERAPDYWELSLKDGKACLKRSEEKKKGVFVLDISEAEVEKSIEVSNGCPVKIIHVQNDKGKKVAPQNHP